MLMLKMAFHIISGIGDEVERELFLHLTWAHQNQGTDEIQAKLPLYKDRSTEYQNCKSSHS